MPDVNHSENVKEHVTRHGLSMNEPESVIVCRTCSFAPGDPTTAVTNHLTKKLNTLMLTTKELRSLLRPYTFLGPEALRLCLDGFTPHPHLQVLFSIAYRHCSLKSNKP